ncbi:MAG: hypothetical protein M3Z06_15025 [Actinomycetota bacterium]|nr:hypothetical protein [Actinomycetota bacterium]
MPRRWVLAAEQASRDYSRQIEAEIERHRARELAAAQARSEEYEATLRRQEREFLEQRDRLARELREHLASVSQHVEEARRTSQELARMIRTEGRPDLADPHGAESNGDAGDMAGSRLGAWG